MIELNEFTKEVIESGKVLSAVISDVKGIHICVKFDNGYGCSIIRHIGSYGSEDGLWELAVLLVKDDKCMICYDTPITDDVLGYLTEEDVLEYISKIKALKALS